MATWNFYRTDHEMRKSRRRTEEWTIPAIKRFYVDAREFFVQSDSCSLPFDSDGFDVTMCMEALEHIGAPNTNREKKPRPEYRANRKRALEELLLVTKPGGLILSEGHAAQPLKFLQLVI